MDADPQPLTPFIRHPATGELITLTEAHLKPGTQEVCHGNFVLTGPLATCPVCRASRVPGRATCAGCEV